MNHVRRGVGSTIERRDLNCENEPGAPVIAVDTRGGLCRAGEAWRSGERSGGSEANIDATIEAESEAENGAERGAEIDRGEMTGEVTTGPCRRATRMTKRRRPGPG